MSLAESDIGRVMLTAAAKAYRRNTSAHEDRPHPLVPAVAAALQALGVELRAQNMARSRGGVTELEEARLLESARMEKLMTSLAYIVGLPAVWRPVVEGKAPPVVGMPAADTPETRNGVTDVEDTAEIRWIRDYLDDLDAALARCRARNESGCSVCIERGKIAEDIRQLLPAAAPESPDVAAG